MAPTTQQTIVVGRFDWAVTSREIPTRDGTGRGWRRSTSWRWRWPGRVPWAGGADRMQRTGETPLMTRADGTPDVCRAHPDQIYPDRFRFRQIAVKTSPAGKPPLTSGSTGTYAEFVIAIADLEHCRYSALVCPAISPPTSLLPTPAAPPEILSPAPPPPIVPETFISVATR